MIYSNKIWISGAEGRLGSTFVEGLNPMDVEILATDKDIVDVSSSSQVINFVDRNRPDYIINCSALTDTIYCEENPDDAFKVNGLGARNMAVAASRVNAKLIHLSSDDVFDGLSKYPYKEYDHALPKSTYGKSKLFGEEQVRSFCLRHFILRSSWLYGTNYKRVEEMIRKAENGEEILVAKEQFAAPTSADEVSKFIVHLMQTAEYGTYHAVCKGSCSRKEFAEKVLELAGVEGKVRETDEIVDASFRPEYSVLDDFIIRITGEYSFPTWEKALENYLERIHKLKR